MNTIEQDRAVLDAIIRLVGEEPYALAMHYVLGPTAWFGSQDRPVAVNLGYPTRLIVCDRFTGWPGLELQLAQPDALQRVAQAVQRRLQELRHHE